MSIIQIHSITLNNFKNVAHGSVEFKNHILGVYGQNGSGKTAIINALELLQILARGESLHPAMAHYILQGQNSSECTFVFNVLDDEKIAKTLSYTFTIERHPVCQSGSNEKRNKSVNVAGALDFIGFSFLI